MSEKIVTLELRQKDSYTVSNNGDFSVSLQKPLILEDGDEVMLYKSFIDTKAQSDGRISFENDVELEASFGYWTQNWDNTDRSYPTGQPSSYEYLDGDRYVIHKHVNTSYQVVESVSFTYDSSDGGNSFGGKALAFNYIDPNDNVSKKIMLNFPLVKENDSGYFPSQQTTVKPNLKIVPDSFQLVSGQDPIIVSDMKCLPNSYNPVVGATVSGTNILTPLINKVSFTIPKGDYDPLKLCEFINREFTQNDGTIPANSASSNNVLFASTSGGGGYDFINLPSLGAYCMVNQDGTKAYSLGTSRTNQYYFGASQIVFDFQNGRFLMTYNHIPYYVNSGQIGIRYTEKVEVSGPTNEFFLANAHSGLFFTSLHCYDKVDNSTIKLFEDIMGFNMNELIVSPNGNQDITPAGIGAIKGYTYNLVLGENIIAGSDTIDAGIQKNSTFSKVVVPSSLGEVSINASDTYQIISDSVFEVTDTLAYGYFLIEINGNYSTDYRGSKDITSMIKGVVSRYYSYDSYTQATSDASLTYIHKGDSIYLNDFHIRILDADKQLATGIGSDNTLFIQVVKK